MKRTERPGQPFALLSPPISIIKYRIMDEHTFVSIDSEMADVVMIDMNDDAAHSFVMVDDGAQAMDFITLSDDAEFSTPDDIIDIVSDMDDAADISVFS